MKLEALLGGLTNDDAAVRLDVVRVLGMLEETRALDALRLRYHDEPDTTVRSLIAWAGKRIYDAQQAGYSTLDALCRYFGVDRELETMPDANEAALMRKLEEGLDADLRRMQEQAGKRRLGLAAAAGLGGALLGGTMAGVGAATSTMMGGMNTASSNLGGRGDVGSRRAPAMRPTNDDITIWAKRLRESLAPAAREQAAVELAQLNNPAALPYLAAAFVLDPAEKVRSAAERYGKLLYWGAVYWEMDLDGTLAAEMQQRAAGLGKSIAPARPNPTISADAPSLPAPAAPAPEQKPAPPRSDVSEILRRAQAERAKRRRKK